MVNTKEHLIKALKTLQMGFATREIRFHISQALQKLSKLDKKEQKQEKYTPAQSWNDMIKNGIKNPNTSKRTIDIINQMLAAEKNNAKSSRIDDIDNSILNE